MKPTIDTKIAEPFIYIVCDRCKAKIISKTKRVRPFDMLNPLRLAKHFVGAVCPDCKQKIINKMRENNERKE